MSSKKSFKVKCLRSRSGATHVQKEALRCLGLRKIGHEVIVKDSPSTRGQILKVQHLVEVSLEGK